MKPGVKLLTLFLFIFSMSQVSAAQCNNSANACTQIVPRLVRFNGTLKNIPGILPGATVAVRFLIYADSTGGTPLWQEVQNVGLDPQGHYDLLLGATESEGIPQDLFASGQPRWLGVLPLVPGVEEQPRVLMASVPYALQAQNAQTLGGLPASAFAKAGTTSAVVTSSVVETESANPTATTLAATGAAASSQAVTISGATINTIPKFSSAQALTDSQISDRNGVVSMENLSNILFADAFPGGVSAAITACPSNGCIIYALSPAVNLSLGNIDPGYKAITIYLGPYTFTVNQITLRKSLKIIGMGASGGVNGSPTCSVAAPCNGTALQSVNGNNPVFVIPQTNNEPATNVELSGFRLYGSAGNTSEDGFLLDTSSTVNTGLWSSVLNDISVSGFAGVGIHIKGRVNDFAATCQWILFNNVVSIRNAGGGNALRLEGSVFELRFRNCQFDGQAMGDGTNIYIGGYSGPGGGYPTSIAFEGLVSQQAALAVQINGGVNIVFYASHHEALLNAYQVTYSTNKSTNGLTITDSYFAGNVGVNGGAGYLLNVATTDASGIVFAHNHILGTPDSVVTSTNFASVVYQDNFANPGSTNVPPTSGLTTQISPATSINTQGVHTVGLNPSTTPITTIQSGLGPGEMITFYILSGPVTFASGGNIDLIGMNSVTVTGTITFVRTDLGGLLWKPVAQWSPTPSAPSTQASLVP
jgi:hypothetical protein